MKHLSHGVVVCAVSSFFSLNHFVKSTNTKTVWVDDAVLIRCCRYGMDKKQTIHFTTSK